MADRNGPNVNISGGTVGAFAVGDNVQISDVRATSVASGVSGDIVELLEQLREGIEGGGLATPAKTDALSAVAQLEQELKKPVDDRERQSGMAYWLERLSGIVDDTGVLPTVKALASAVGVALG